MRRRIQIEAVRTNVAARLVPWHTGQNQPTVRATAEELVAARFSAQSHGTFYLFFILYLYPVHFALTSGGGCLLPKGNNHARCLDLWYTSIYPGGGCSFTHRNRVSVP